MFLSARNGTELFISFIHDKFIVKLRNGPISYCEQNMSKKSLNEFVSNKIIVHHFMVLCILCQVFFSDTTYPFPEIIVSIFW